MLMPIVEFISMSEREACPASVAGGDSPGNFRQCFPIPDAGFC